MRYARIRVNGAALASMLKDGNVLKIAEGLPHDARFIRMFMEPVDQFYSIEQLWIVYESAENEETPEGVTILEKHAPVVENLTEKEASA
jgi:hypothetical protein